MTRTIALTIVLSACAIPVWAQAPVIASLLTKDVVGAPGKELLIITVEYGPGGSDPVHRHQAQAAVYVLEGSVVMQVSGKPAVTLGPGEMFYEAPDDVHLVARNASDSAPAKFLVVFVKEKGAPFKTSAQ